MSKCGKRPRRNEAIADLGGPNLPAGWLWKSVGELAAKEPNAITDGPFGSKLKTEHYTRSGPRVVRLANIGDAVFVDARVHISESHFSALAKHRVFPGDIVIAALGETLPRSCMIPETLGPAIVKADCIRFKPSAEHSAKYLNYALNWEGTQKRTAAIVHGVGRPRLNSSEIKSVLLPVAPAGVQSGIVAEIEKQFTRLEAGFAALRRVQANLRRYRAAVLKAACEGRLFVQEPSARASGSWPLAELGDFVESMKNGIYKPASAYAADGVACLRMYNIDDGKIVWRDIKRMRLNRAEVNEFGLLPGDLLVNRVNSRELVGKAAPIGEQSEPMVFESKNIRVRVNCEEVDPKFIGFVLAVYGPAHFNRNAQQVVGMASISQPQVRAIQFHVPPVPEQRQIVAEVERRLSVIEELDTVVTIDLRRAARLRQAILERAFCGRLTGESSSVNSSADVLD